MKQAVTNQVLFVVGALSLLLLGACAPRVDSPIPTRDIFAIATRVAANNTATAISLIPTSTPTVTILPTPAFEYQAVLDMLGPSALILPLVADIKSNSFGATFPTVGARSLDFTWSEPVTDFDTPPSLEGEVPVVTFNGNDEAADTPDTAGWSIGAGEDAAFSLGFWIYYTGGNDEYIFTKNRTSVTNGDWNVHIGIFNRLAFRLWDDSEGSHIGRADVGGMPTNQWVHVVGTYDGTATEAGIKIYENGVRSDDFSDSSGAYSAMENTTAIVRIGQSAAGGVTHFTGKMAGGPIGPFFTRKELSASEVTALYDMGKAALALP